MWQVALATFIWSFSSPQVTPPSPPSEHLLHAMIHNSTRVGKYHWVRHDLPSSMYNGPLCQALSEEVFY